MIGTGVATRHRILPIGYVIFVKLPEWVTDPHKFRRFNGWATVVWFFLAFPICIFLSNSIPLLVFISVYAIVTGHLSTWQAGNVEVRQEEDDDVAEVSEKVDKLRDEQ